MSVEYQTFLKDPEGIPEGQEIEIVIKDLTPGPRKYDGSRVKAVIRKSSPPGPGEHKLLVRSEVGVLQPQIWSVRIIERLHELIPVPPYSDYKLSK